MFHILNEIHVQLLQVSKRFEIVKKSITFYQPD